MRRIYGILFFVIVGSVATLILLNKVPLNKTKTDQPKLVFQPNSNKAENFLEKKEPAIPVVSPLVVPQTAMMKIVSAPGSNLAAGQSFILQVIADSVGEDVVGFDIVIPFQKDDGGGYTEFVSARSMISGFDIYTTNKDGLLIITGVKNIANQNKTPFNNESIASLVFSPVRSGRIVFDLPLYKDNPTLKSYSKLLTDKNEDILRKTEPFIGFID